MHPCSEPDRRSCAATMNAACQPVAAPIAAARLAAPGCLDGGDIDLPHLHHGFKSPSGRRTIRVGNGRGQHTRRDLPGQPPAVLAPAALAFLAAVADDGVPQAIRFLLIVRRNLKRKRLVVLEDRAAVQAQAGDSFSNHSTVVVKNLPRTFPGISVLA